MRSYPLHRYPIGEFELYRTSFGDGTGMVKIVHKADDGPEEVIILRSQHLRDMTFALQRMQEAFNYEIDGKE